MIHFENGADLSHIDIEGETLLHLAVSTSVPITTFLLDHNAVIDAVNKSGRTPFIVSTVHQKLETAMLLWKRGADINIRDNDNHSAFTICDRSFDNPIAQIFKDDQMQRRIAFAMAFHERLGGASPLRHLGIDVRPSVYDTL